MSAVALVLVAHGSPDPRWVRPLEDLRDRCGSVLGAERVGLAFLAHAPSLSEAIGPLVDAGAERIVVVAALLSAGGRHVRHDIPEAVALARREFPSLAIELVEGALGEQARVLDALAEAALACLGPDKQST